MECLVLFVWPLSTHLSSLASLPLERMSRRVIFALVPFTQRDKPYGMKHDKINHFQTNSQVRYICQHCKILPVHPYCSSVAFIALPASQPAADGLWGVKPPEPSTLHTVLALTPIPNIHTNTQCSSLSVCPQCFQVTGWGAKWHHATKCHLAPSRVPCWAPWQLQAGLCACGLISGPNGATRRGLAGAGTGLALAPASVCSI